MIQTVTEIANGFAPARARADSASRSSARSFEQIMDDYWSNADRGSALDYLQTLSGEELRSVGREHGFANPNVNLYGITVEGSHNLLRSRGETVDENRDGIDQIGEARIWRFPNSGTPANVKSAWEDATQGMGDGERLLMAGALFLPLPRIVEDPNTGATSLVHPGEPEYQDRARDSGYSYAATLASKLAALDDPNNPPESPEFYRQAKAFYEALRERFERYGVS